MTINDIQPRPPEFWHAKFGISYESLLQRYTNTLALWQRYEGKALASKSGSYRGFTLVEIQLLIKRQREAIAACEHLLAGALA